MSLCFSQQFGLVFQCPMQQSSSLKPVKQKAGTRKTKKNKTIKIKMNLWVNKR